VIDLTQINNTSLGGSTSLAPRRNSTMKQFTTHKLYASTDGSGIKGQIGAAAYCPELSKTAMQHVGPETEFNVYAAELLATNIASNPSNQRETDQSRTQLRESGRKRGKTANVQNSYVASPKTSHSAQASSCTIAS